MFSAKLMGIFGMFAVRQCKRHIATSSQLLRDSKRGDVCDKAALVTGGASGIGLQCCKTLLRCGCRGVTIADRDNDCGEQALQELADEFGNDKAVFVNCDVTKSEHIDWAFKTTLNAFDRLDIVINNAGVLNDKVWENEINTNICGTMVGSLLGLQYMAAHCAGQGGYVINIASTMGLKPFGGCPIYSMTQSAILGLTRALGSGSHIDRTKVKVIALALGLTETPLMLNATKHAINNRFSADFKRELECHDWQKPDVVSGALMTAIKDGEGGAIWVVECGSKPYKICIPCHQEMKMGICATKSVPECETPGVRSEPFKSKSKPTKTEDKKEEKSDKEPRPTSCGTCPEPVWHGGPPKKFTEKKEAAAGAAPKAAAGKKGVKMTKKEAKKIEKKAPAAAKAAAKTGTKKAAASKKPAKKADPKAKAKAPAKKAAPKGKKLDKKPVKAKKVSKAVESKAKKVAKSPAPTKSIKSKSVAKASACKTTLKASKDPKVKRTCDASTEARKNVEGKTSKSKKSGKSKSNVCKPKKSKSDDSISKKSTNKKRRSNICASKDKSQ